MSIGKKSNDTKNSLIIQKGMKISEVFDKLDVAGSTVRYVDYRESNGLPLPQDMYEKQKDGSYKIKNTKKEF